MKMTPIRAAKETRQRGTTLYKGKLLPEKSCGANKNFLSRRMDRNTSFDGLNTLCCDRENMLLSRTGARKAKRSKLACLPNKRKKKESKNA